MRRFSFLTGLAAIIAWVSIETIVFNLVAGWTGGLLAFLLFVSKSLAGFLFVGKLLRRKMMNLSELSVLSLQKAAVTTTSLKIFGAFLLVIPGFLAGIIGMALLTPSICTRITGLFGRKIENPRDFDLKADDWKEIPDLPSQRISRRRDKDSTGK